MEVDDKGLFVRKGLQFLEKERGSVVVSGLIL